MGKKSDKSAKQSDPAAAHGKRSAVRAAAERAALSPIDAFRAPAAPVQLSAIDTEAGPIGPRDKDEAAELMADLAVKLEELQGRLIAGASTGNRRRVLVVLQGMDTAGKDGIINHSIGLLNPGGLTVASFKKPTAEELAHDFLWRIEKEVPEPGQVGVFNRSQYEDVLVVRVHNLVPSEVWSGRYDSINAFEQALADDGVVIVKCFLHISKDTQAERLTARLEDPAKTWKYNPGDLVERGFWDDYQVAYAAALEKCNTEAAPWYVIPSDRKWYRNWAVAALLEDVLRRMDPQYPEPTFDVAAERERLAEHLRA